MLNLKYFSFFMLSVSLMWANVASPLEIGIGPSSEETRIIFEGNLDFVDQLIAELSFSVNQNGEPVVGNVRLSFPSHLYVDFILNGDDPDLGYEFLNNFQEALTRFNSAGIDVTLLLAYGSKHNFKVIPGCEEYPPGEPDWLFTRFPPVDEVWIQYVQEMMTRFGGQISGVEVWNEPDMIGGFFRGRVEDYIHLFKISEEEINLHFPSLPVSTGGLACKTAIYRSYLEAILNPVSGVYSQCDAIGLHFYNGTALERLRIYFEICNEMGLTPKPVWATEFGRELDEIPEEKIFTSEGAQAYPSHVMEVFSSYGVERAF